MDSNYHFHGKDYYDESCEIFVGIYLDIDISGEIYNRVGSNVSTMVGAMNEIQDNYNIKGMLSVDGLLRPFSMDGEGGLPQYIQYTTPPNMCGTCITLDDLNPLTNPSGLARSHVSRVRSDTPTIGHDFDIVARNGTSGFSANKVPEGGLIMPTAGVATNNPYLADYRADYRSMALKGPIVIKSWGYHCDGSPVPNKNDSAEAAAQGIFVSNPSGRDKDKFLDGHLYKSKTWPVAPFDLRMDIECGVWRAFACNGIDRLIPATLSAQSSPGSIVSATNNLNSSGITILNNSTLTYGSGTCVIAKRTYGCNYELVYGECNVSGVSVAPSGSFDCVSISGYVSENFQILAHLPNSGCQWISVTSGCP